MDIPNNFSEFITLIGSPVFIGVIISFLFTRWAFFVNMPSQAKFWIVGAVSIFLPIISRALTLYLPVDVAIFLADWYPTVAVGLGVWVSSQIWNKLFGLDGAISKADTPEDIANS